MKTIFVVFHLLLRFDYHYHHHH